MADLQTISRKIQQQVRITEDDALELFHSADLVSLGELADLSNQRQNQGAVFYNINRHINPTNVCVLSCRFCDFAGLVLWSLYYFQ